MRHTFEDFRSPVRSLGLLVNAGGLQKIRNHILLALSVLAGQAQEKEPATVGLASHMERVSDPSYLTAVHDKMSAESAYLGCLVTVSAGIFSSALIPARSD